MSDLPRESVHLVITSPPYWHLKDYGCESQIGFNDSLETYFSSLSQVWCECFRVLHPGCRMAVNIGDQFARAAHYGRYKVIPLHAQIIADAENAGFDFMGSIIWQKVTSQNASGGGAVMGSFPLPRNGIVKLDYEHILLFKKLGVAPKPTEIQKQNAAMTTEEWNRFFAGHWHFPGEKQGDGHLAMFPLELPRRLITMFSFPGETVLDPFLGSGTTIKAAMELERIGVGYEINREFKSAICARLGLESPTLWGENVEFVDSQGVAAFVDERKSTKFERQIDPKTARFGSVLELDDLQARPERGQRARALSSTKLELSNGEQVGLRGVRVLNGKEDEATQFLDKLLRNRGVFLSESENGAAYVHLNNKTFVNAKMIRAGLCEPDEMDHPLAARFEILRSRV